MGHIVIPRNVIPYLSQKNMWVMLKKNPRYWLMVTACMVAAPSCAISTMVRKIGQPEFVSERANVKLMKDESKYEKYLRSNN